MSVDELICLPCAITHAAQAGAADEYGNPTITTSTSSTVCYLEQVSRSEQTAGSDTQAESWSLFLPAGTAIDGTDTVAVDGYGTFELDGPPWPVWNPRVGVAHHVECRARRVV